METPIGPAPISNSWHHDAYSGTAGGPNSGRVNGIAVSADGKTMYVGSDSGGVWSSSDNGVSWKPLTDNQLTGIGIGAVATDPSNSNQVYAGTGNGLLASSNAGSTWTIDAGSAAGCSTPVFQYQTFHTLAVDPHNPTDLYAGTSNGLWVSFDGGASWQIPTNVNGSRPGCSGAASFGLALDASTTPTTVYITQSGVGIEKSIDGGHSFNLIGVSTLPSPATFGVTPLAIGQMNGGSPGNNFLYAAIQLQPWQNGPTDPHNGTKVEIWRSEDFGQDWTLLANVPNYTRTAGSTLNWDQAGYDNVIAVDPNDPTHLLAGGVQMIESHNAGANWGVVAGPNVFGIEGLHDDQHAIAFLSNGDALIGNDGGIYEWFSSSQSCAATGATVQLCNMNTNLQDLLTYGDISVSTDQSVALAGFQDNGTAYR